MSARAELWRSGERALIALAGVGGHLAAAAAALTRWSGPRERLLRKRRAARTATIGLAASTGVLGAATVGLTVHPVAGWLVSGLAGTTALVAVPTVITALHLRSLRRMPLPALRSAPLRRTRRNSRAYDPLLRLSQGERSLAALLGLLERDPAVPTDEVDRARVAAAAAVSALRQEASDLVALEGVRDTSPTAAGELNQTVSAAGQRLDQGVLGYDSLVAAAARAVAARYGPERHTEGLSDAVDRVDALTAALVELAGRPVPPR